MDIDKYTELTGITVSPSQEASVNAMIRRTKSMLETLLGFSLKPKYLYTEKGKVQFQGLFPNTDLNTLLPPDDEEGNYKLFQYNERDKYFHVDPFTNIYHVKLVLPQNDGEFITILDLKHVAAQYGRDAIAKYIERYSEWFTWDWYPNLQLLYCNSERGGLQLAVDADWIKCLPEDLMFLWADMVTFYADGNSNIKSESVDGHSWTKDNTDAPEEEPSSILVLQRYAGPYGSIMRNPVR